MKKKKKKKRENGDGWLAIESWRGGGGRNTEEKRVWFGFVLEERREMSVDIYKGKNPTTLPSRGPFFTR